jgi:hypothetical protein
MKWITFALFICLFTARADACDASNAYIYDSTSDSRAIVLNLDSKMLSFQDKRSIRIDEITEFSGSLEDCGNEKYFCLRGAVDIVIPKIFNAAQSKWTHRDITCSAKPINERKARKIVCLRAVDREGTEVEYSPSHGIVNLRQTPPHDQTLFRLRGDCGIFANQPLAPAIP